MANLPPVKKTQLADSLRAKNKTGALRTEPNPQYPKPSVVEAPNGVLDPSVADPAGVTVKVGYDSMVTSDRIKVTFNGYVFAPIGGSADREVQLSVPAAQVAATVGKHVEVSYTVVRPSGPIDSMPLDLEVQTMPAASLPAPEITQAQDGVLDLTAFTGVANLTVKKWPLSVTGQRVWLTVSGPGGVPSLNILNGYPILASEAADGIARDIARSELEKYADGSQMTVVLKVAFDGAMDEAGALAFPLLTVTLVKEPELSLPRPILAGVSHGGTLDPVTVGAYAVLTVSYTRIRSGDKVSVVWDGSASDYIPAEQTAIDDTALTFNVPKQQIRANAGGSVRVAYTVTRNSISKTSENLNFSVKTIPQVNDLTDFTNGTWNGWTITAGTDPRNWSIYNNGNPCAMNLTYDDRSAGPVLYKTFNNLINGENYQFSIAATRRQPQLNSPVLSLQVDNSRVSEVATLVYGSWTTLTGTFVGTGRTMTLLVWSHVASGQGNDYLIDNIRVRSV